MDYKDEVSKIDKITLEINNHQIDVSDKTYYKYEYDDLKPFKEYKVTLTVHSEQVITKSTMLKTGFLGNKWPYPFISNPKYIFKEKKISPRVMSFNKEFKIEKKIKKAEAYITAFGIYNFYLNDKKINKEYFLPGFTSYSHQLQYQYFDITKEIKSNNKIDIDVAGGWAIGSFVMSRKNRISDDKQSLSMFIKIIYEDDKEEIISSDNSFLVSNETPYLYADLYDGEGFDNNFKKDYSKYNKAEIYKTRNNPDIIANYGSNIVIKKELTPKFVNRINDKDIYDFGQNFAGIIYFEIENATKGQEIIINHAEILDNNGELNTKFLRSAKAEIRYICSDGKQHYSPTFTYMGFRYISVKGIEKDNIKIKAYVLSSDNLEIGNFNTDHKLLNRLNQNIYWSSLSNFMDIPTDCPQRDERMGWTGDIAVFAPTALFNFDLSSFLNKWLKDARSEQLKTGGIPNTIPSQGYGFPETMPKMAIEFWGDVILFVPHALYRQSGNLDYIANNYEAMKKYVNACLFWARFMSLGEHRYIWHTPSLFHFGDWVAPDVDKMSSWQKRSIYTATCAIANSTKLLSDFAKLLNKEEDHKKYLEINNKIKNAFNNILTNKNGVLKQEFQTGYVLPLYFDMFNDIQKQNALNRLVKLIKDNNYHIGTGFPGTPYILFVLADNGYIDEAYKMLLCESCPSWLYEAKVGGTTIWERWDGLDENGKCPISNDGTGGMISYNHYASGAVGDFLYSRLAGIRLTTPGYKDFEINPILSEDINKVQASTLSPYGKIEVNYKKDNKNFDIFVRVPLRTKATLIMPNKEKIVLNPGVSHYSCKL